MRDFPVQAQMRAQMEVGPGDQPVDVLPLVRRRAQARIARQVDAQPRLAGQRQIDVAIRVERQEFQPVQRIVGSRIARQSSAQRDRL